MCGKEERSGGALALRDGKGKDRVGREVTVKGRRGKRGEE